ncbi:hypothetical protein AJ80_03642 [Polytolypa hystricis UAMH7299]|uniref:Major facilitator superfamily (MFS) profile domain-containing protein n=1 Tax=Polytolypa hystricis (strain UAMH7299) TaxID=1447883 RepID=A0A2B7Y8I0_POLH7|nr:hypothetical protein AJ80_03642 [Polytolypa hystricis UAMH7299]
MFGKIEPPREKSHWPEPTKEKDNNGESAESTDVEHSASDIGAGEVEGLSAEHREYLLGRHGTVELDPIPKLGAADPYNWPTWKKHANLALVAIHACMATFTAAAIIPAFGEIAEDLGIPIHNATYLTSLQIAVLGGAPLFWKPLSSRFGRRPIFLLSLICSFAGNIGCAKSSSYAAVAACRAIVAFFISPAAAIGSAVVTETYFKKDRGRYMGVWTLMVTIGIPGGAFLFGFVAHHIGYHWIYWILAIINGVQFILYIFFGPETRYLRDSKDVGHEGASSFRQGYLTFKRIDPSPLTFWEFIEPLSFFFDASALIPAAAYAMIFLFGVVMITVEIPSLFIPKFGFNPQQLGLQYIGVIIGTVIGEQLGGALSDYWMNRRTRQLGARPEHEYRLWLSYSGFLLTIVGVIVFLVQTERATQGSWNVTPIVGVAFAACGNQIVTTVLVTYTVDCYPERSASVGVFITFVRQIWGFIGPFWMPSMFESVGLAASSGVTTALIVGFSVIPTVLIQWRGRKWRAPKGQEE